MPKEELARGSYKQVEWAVKLARMPGRKVVAPDQTRKFKSLEEISRQEEFFDLIMVERRLIDVSFSGRKNCL